jgi:hypothetical protein
MRQPMKKSLETKYVDIQKSVTGFGETRDIAFNELLRKLRLSELKIGCAGGYRPLLNPPDNIKFRVYSQNSSDKVRWKCSWGPGVLEFECAPREEFDD